MAQYRLNAYDADVFITEFKGLQQAGDGVGSDLRFAMEAENVETPGGVLQPFAEPVVGTDEFTAKIETLARLHRRWYTGSGSKDWLFVATGGKLYYKQSGDSGSWTQLSFPTGVTAYQSDVWSWVSYEINPEGAASPVDVLLISNALDGMFIVTPPYTATASNPDWKVEAVTTGGKKFAVIERYAERIWGGGIPDDPDTLMYSAPFDPTDWTANTQTPEDGAGDIQQPSWDGDSFTALRAFGSQLIAFKKHRVWRILGTNPGEYTFKEQYGGGAPYYNTIAVQGERIFLADRDGLCTYDGLNVSPYARQEIEKLWRTVNKNALDQMCGAMFDRKYYLSFPTNGATANNDMLVYNTADGTLLYYTGVNIESFLVTEDALLATSSSLPGKILTIPYDSWQNGGATARNVRWVSPWIDFGRKSIAKGGYEIYFSPEVKQYPVVFRFGIQTEKKTKYKNVTVFPTIAKAKQKRVRFGGTGRKFRLIIEVPSNSAGAEWRLTGGIQMIVETDAD